MKVSTKVKESPEQAAARKAEEDRIALAEGKAVASEIGALRRDSDRKTRRVLRAFGNRSAMSAMGGVANPFVAAVSGGSGFGGGGGGGGGFAGGGGGGGGYGGFADFGDFGLGSGRFDV